MIWGSNVLYDESCNDDGCSYDGAYMKGNLTTSHGMKLDNGVGIDASYIAYLYPSIDDSNFGELLMTFSYNIASLTYMYSPNLSDYDGKSDDDPSHYLALGLEHKVSQSVTVGTTAGYIL